MPLLKSLMLEVEKRYGRRLSSSKDYESLSVLIEYLINERISASTLKRIWGYVSSHPTPREATLDILSRFAGFKNFKDFCNHIKQTSLSESEFFSAQSIESSDIPKCACVLLGWGGSCQAVLEYLGGFKYRVIESINNDLLPQDEFYTSGFILGVPLYITSVFRNGENTVPFVAGNAMPFGHKMGYAGDVMTKGYISVLDKKDILSSAGMIVVDNVNDIHIELAKLK